MLRFILQKNLRYIAYSRNCYFLSYKTKLSGPLKKAEKTNDIIIILFYNNIRERHM